MKTKIYTSLIFGIMLLGIQPGYAQNVLYDGSFETTTLILPYSTGVPPVNIWNAFNNDGTISNATVVAGVCNYQVTNAGSNTWEVQLEQTGFPLVQGDYYRLTFDVKADAERWFGLYLGEYAGSWTSLIGWDNYWQYASADWHTISIDFQASAIFDTHKFSLEIGGNNVSMYFDNIMLKDLGPYPSIGIIGTALSGWDVDVDMLTTDGINYSLSNIPLTGGMARFRQSNSWSISWGNNTFPTGIGYIYGPNIPILNFGNYDITFNRETGEYTFNCVSNCPVAIGIIGSAVPPNYDVGPDVNLSTNDGINYKLKGYMFNDGEAKFRLDDSWDINWGNTDFPAGAAIQGGPAIQVAKGNYDVKFNIVTGEYKFEAPMIGILGSALNGWDTDVDMQTTDGMTYTLMNYTFTDGYAKFRQDDNWDVNWGGYSFPTGWSFQDGPDISVLAGTYNVTFNMVTGEYSFTATTCPNVGIQCPGTVYMGSSPGICGAEVYFPPVVAAANCGGEGLSIIQTGGLQSGSLFPVGTTTNTFELTNAAGKTATCSFDVMVFDYEAPVITGINDPLPPLWPPNHRMVPVHLNYSTSDNCKGIITNEIYVYSNEPDNGLGDGDLATDWMITDDHNILLRAERSGKGTGRVYYIYIVSHDNSYNYNYQMVTVSVPHDFKDLKAADGTIEIGNQSEAKSFKVNAWPNPSNQNFKIQVESTSNETIDVFVTDVIGRQISRFQSTNLTTVSFGDDLKPGIYFIKVMQGDHLETIKAVKK